MSVKAGILEQEQKKFEYQTVMIAACQWVDGELLTNQRTGFDSIGQSEDGVNDPHNPDQMNCFVNVLFVRGLRLQLTVDMLSV